MVLLRRYELLDEIGSGAMGTVYSALDTKLQRKVAIKVLHRDRLSPDQIARLHREAKIIGQMNHPCVVDIYDFDLTPKNEPVMVMEFLDGESLHDILKRTRHLSVTESLRIFIQICDAMEHAHKRGLIHRDLKPGNIMLIDKKAKVLDFGMAKDSFSQDATITKEGAFVGTPSSISPEQASGKEVDHRTDIYSMGCVMYETLTGKLPFHGDNTIDTILKQVNEPAPSLKEGKSSKNFPADVEEIVARALKKKPDERFENMAVMKSALQKALAKHRGEPIESAGESVEDLLPEEKEAITDPKQRKKELTFSRLEAVFKEPAVTPQSEPKSASLTGPLVVGVLILGVLTLCGFAIAGIYAPDDMAPQAISEQRATRSFETSHKNDMNWYKISDPITPDKIKDLSKESNVDHLNLSTTSVNNQQLSEFAKLPLDLIDLRSTKLSDDGLRILSRVATLRGILLDGCTKITPEGFKALRQLRDLRVLSAANADLDDRHIEALGSIKSLRFVRISKNPKITNAAAPYLTSIPKLTSVAIGKTGIRKDGLLLLQRDLKLSYLGLRDHGLTDDDIPMISNSLGLIDLNGNKITGITTKKIGKLDDIWFVDIRNCPGVTEHNSRLLEASLREGQVWSDHNAVELSDTKDSEWYLEPANYDRSWLGASLKLDVMEWQRHFAHPELGEHILDQP